MKAEVREFTEKVTVFAEDGMFAGTFNRGDRIKDINWVGQIVTFEAADMTVRRGPYRMEWHRFEKSTTTVRAAQA